MAEDIYSEQHNTNDMSYQTSSREVQETYHDDTPDTGIGRLLSSGRSSTTTNDNVNVGYANSSRGFGTTTSELILKFRFLNCLVCLLIISFHTLPMILNPIRLTLLLSSPMKLLLELIAALLALSLFLVEARIPILGEKVLLLMRKISLGNVKLIDMNIARGRVIALTIIGLCLGLVNYLALDLNMSESNDSGSDDETAIPSIIVSNDMNVTTNTNNTVSNTTTYTELDHNDTNVSVSKEQSMSMLFIIFQCTSPSIWILVVLIGYTIYIMNEFPEIQLEKAYEIEESDQILTPVSSSGPSWTNNVGSYVRENVSSIGQGGYQTSSSYQTIDA